MNKNQFNGKKFEEEFCWYLSTIGFYVVYNEKNSSGAQPVDVIAISDDKPYMFECKNLENKNGIFPLSRIESNQLHSYEKFKECGNSNFGLAILWNNNVYIIDFFLLQFFEKSINLKNVEPNIKDWDKEMKTRGIRK